MTLLAAVSATWALRAGGTEIRSETIAVSGNTVYRWQQADVDYSLLQGDCQLALGEEQWQAETILVAVDGPPGRVRSRLVLQRKGDTPEALTLLSLSEPQIMAPRFRGAPRSPSPLLTHLPGKPKTASGVEHALAMNPSDGENQIQPAQFALPAPAPVPDPAPDGSSTSNGVTSPPGAMSEPLPPGTPTLPPGTPTLGAGGGGSSGGGFKFFTAGGRRSIEIVSRGATTPLQLETIDRPELGETMVLARGGVTVLIRDVTAQLPGGELMELGTISLSADRVLGWLPLVSDLFSGNTSLSQADGELYLEGDIVFRQGERIIYAESMYYNVTAEQGMVLNAEAITTIPEYQGVVRLKADVLQQINQGNFIAFDAAVTSSRMGVPRYWLQSEQLSLTDRARTVVDPITGVPRIDREPFVESNDNFVFFAGVPLLYWPTFATSLERPTYYLSNIKVKNDNTFGTQVLVDLDLIQLLGLENAPNGLDWLLSLDYLSDRGPAAGTSLDYSLPGLFGVPGPVNGLFDAWLIDDRGLDRLGRDRLALQPEETTRGRALLRHRHYLPYDYELIGELGWISDRNFLEQYLENEWDQQVDHRTALRLRRYGGNQMIDLHARAQLNDFFTTTERLPQLDHYLLGSSLFNDWLTYSAHNKVGYAKLNVADTPENPAEAAEYSALPGEANREGVIAHTRQELAMPLPVGPVKVVPYVSGEASHYGEATDGDSLTRLLGQAGVRASLSAWRFDPSVQSSLLNVRGLAHKLEWTAEYFYADSDTNLNELPLYDPLDDNPQEQFRRRFIQDTFGGALPARFDPRTYALRHGFQSWVTSPSDVIADDLEQLKFGLHQRWQTKRGLPGRERIVDLFQFDVDLLVFPNEVRDNFGEPIGPATYDARYHVGDRVTLLSDGYFDFFEDGLRSVSAGVRSSRPGLGDIYLGLLSLEGPISSTVVRSSIDYRLNEKWIASAGTTYDFGRTGNVGQSVGITRIGESLLLRLGVNVDSGRDNVGVDFGIEPRFWPRPKLGRIGGQLIPPPGVEGLE